ncbi:hypothetical protein ACPOL_2617 [Acidisarcina polymorpha]|uniref:Uncharacterized protein n=1 Tax=Acidisarcina polymorpha TaxID=2211140 RepID=A0A2Z5FYF1_9BACT|nr:hypothetical protein ACPOL_2617 [Acidisarcina polymorpha]
MRKAARAWPNLVIYVRFESNGHGGSSDSIRIGEAKKMMAKR